MTLFFVGFLYIEDILSSFSICRLVHIKGKFDFTFGVEQKVDKCYRCLEEPMQLTLVSLVQNRHLFVYISIMAILLDAWISSEN